MRVTMEKVGLKVREKKEEEINEESKQIKTYEATRSSLTMDCP